MARVLDVYLHQRKTGTLTQQENGQLNYSYCADYLNGTALPPLSVAMPLREEPYPDTVTRAYFSGLLPDERARHRLAEALGVSANNAFGLLEIIGGECAGALTVIPQGSDLADFSSAPIEPLDNKQLAEVLNHLRERPLLGGEEGIRLSLAGVHDKLAVCVVDGQIALAKGGRPTTHILKPFIEGLEGTVDNELFCMKLGASLGLEVPTVTKGSAGEMAFLLVERYDRRTSNDGTIVKLHQEDFCQALSIPPELKYEDEGGPSVARCQLLIRSHTRQPAADLLKLQRMLIFQYLVGNADAHGKNYALLYRDNIPDLAPLYDVVCTAVYPRLTKKLAMQIGDRAIPDTIQLEHWNTLVPPTKAAQRLLAKDLVQMATAVEHSADALLQALDEQGIAHPILKHIRMVIAKRATHLRRLTDQAARSD